MSSSRPPSHKTLTRMPSLGPSFASCFGATLPVSPPRASAQALLAGQAGVNYSRLRFDDLVDDEDQCGYESGGTEFQNSEHLYSQRFRRGWPATAKLGKHSSFKERASSRSSSCRSEVLYMSEGEQETGRERKGGWRLGKQREAAAGSGRYSLKKNSMYDEGGYIEYGNQTKKAAGMELVYDDDDDDDKSGKHRGGKKGSKREKAMKEGGMMDHAHVSEAGDHQSSSPRRRRASFGARMREACVQVLETARRGSPHLSELFVGNQLLMQVTAAASFNSRNAKRMAPSYGLHVFSNHPSYMVSSPAHSTSSAF